MQRLHIEKEVEKRINYLRHREETAEIAEWFDVLFKELNKKCVLKKFKDKKGLCITNCGYVVSIEDYIRYWQYCPFCGGKLTLEESENEH